jgi:hypothetical protein
MITLLLTPFAFSSLGCSEHAILQRECRRDNGTRANNRELPRYIPRRIGDFAVPISIHTKWRPLCGDRGIRDTSLSLASPVCGHSRRCVKSHHSDMRFPDQPLDPANRKTLTFNNRWRI